MTLEEFLKELGLHPDEFTQNKILQYELVLRNEAIDPNKTTLTDLDFRNIDNESKTIQLITT